MLRKWHFSLTLLIAYLFAFLCWKHLPSRHGFVMVAVVIVSGLFAGLVRAWRRGYFVNRIDLCLHAYVLGDLLLEGVAYEAMIGVGRFSSTARLVAQFHDNNSYVFCTLTLTALVGGYRAYALRKRAAAVSAEKTSAETQHENVTEAITTV